MKKEKINIVKLTENMDIFDSYLSSSDEKERNFAVNLLTRGHDFIYRIVNGEYRFYPSRFIGYADNTLEKHTDNPGDGRRTNHRLNSAVGERSLKDDSLSVIYNSYVKKVKPSNRKKYTKKKFWHYDFGGRN